MLIIPTINCRDRKCASDRLQIIKKIKDISWVHIDVADGIATPNKTWSDPKEIKKILEGTDIKIETHLMTDNPFEEYQKWKDIADRIIVQIEDVGVDEIQKLVRNKKEIGVAISPETNIEKLTPYLLHVTFVQILAVSPGPAGQALHSSTLGRIEWLRNKKSEITIECDGGVTEKTAVLLKSRGVDILVSGSYIFSGSNPEEKYLALSLV